MIDEIKPDDTITYEEAVKAFETLDIYVGRTDTCFLAKCVDVATYPSGLADDLFRKVAKNREEARKPKWDIGAVYQHPSFCKFQYRREANGWRSLQDFELYLDDNCREDFISALVKLVPEV